MLEIERRDGNDLLRLAHGRANALDVELTEALRAALRKLREESTGALVLLGSERVFSAGVDLKRVLSGGPAYVEEFLPSMNAMFLELFTFPRPVVAAINGHAIAGGCIMALACDWVVMARGEAEIGMPELPVGVPFPSVPLEIVRNAVSPERFPALILRGKRCRPEEALEVGMIHEICEPAELAARSFDAATRFTAISPVAFEQVKRMIRQPALERMSEQAEAEVLEIWKSPETADRIRGYLDQVLGKRS